MAGCAAGPSCVEMVLAEELEELGMSAAELARRLDVPNESRHRNLERQAGYHR